MLQADISSAFLHGRLSSPVYFHLPMGHPLYGRNNLCYKSNAAVYGLKNSGRIWYLHFTSFLKQYGFIESRTCPGMLYLPAENSLPTVYLCLYVDDFLLASKSKERLQQIRKYVLDNFPAKFTDEVNDFVGLSIQKTGNEVLLHQKKMIEKLSKQYEINGELPQIPMLET